MSQESILKKKSFAFAIKVIRLFKLLKNKHNEYVISQQILRSGTAIGALIREAEFAESRNDFKHKLNIGLKEANETVYWLELLFETGYINKDEFELIISDALELLKMLVASVKTINRQNTP